MILSPNSWPLFYLPLKRPVKPGGFPEIAVLTSAVSEKSYNRSVEQRNPFKFYVTRNLNVFGSTHGEVEQIVYDDIDALLDDGWVVD
jgi:hypothetical protein